MRRRFINLSNKFDYTNYMTIEALEDNVTVTLTNRLYYNLNGTNWKVYGNTITLSNGDFLSFKYTLSVNDNLGAIRINGKCNLRGNCLSLIFGDDAVGKTDISNYYNVFYSLFATCRGIIEVEPTFLPATTLADDCYNNMFYGCTSLVNAPELPATTLAMHCYSSMFSNCTSLTTAPELPATTLAAYCYESMFQGCTSLTTAPELPATTLANECYSRMFQGCTSLTTAPELPATTLTLWCYHYMFYGCTSLTTAPELPATTLAGDCYESMFQGCTSLTTAPELPATTLTTLAGSCYANMFYGCSKLNNITMLATKIIAASCLRDWVNGVASRGTFIKHKDMTSLPTGNNGIPKGWTVVNDGEENEPNLITFTVGGGSRYGIEDKTYTAIEGMTFGEFVNSEYNIDGWSLYYDKYTNKSRILHQYDDVIYNGGGESMFDTNVILESEDYMWT